jgi:hypothetical protein
MCCARLVWSETVASNGMRSGVGTASTKTSTLVASRARCLPLPSSSLLHFHLALPAFSHGTYPSEFPIWSQARSPADRLAELAVLRAAEASTILERVPQLLLLDDLIWQTRRLRLDMALAPEVRLSLNKERIDLLVLDARLGPFRRRWFHIVIILSLTLRRCRVLRAGARAP